MDIHTTSFRHTDIQTYRHTDIQTYTYKLHTLISTEVILIGFDMMDPVRTKRTERTKRTKRTYGERGREGEGEFSSFVCVSREP